MAKRPQGPISYIPTVGNKPKPLKPKPRTASQGPQERWINGDATRAKVRRGGPSRAGRSGSLTRSGARRRAVTAVVGGAGDS